MIPGLSKKNQLLFLKYLHRGRERDNFIAVGSVKLQELSPPSDMQGELVCLNKAHVI